MNEQEKEAFATNDGKKISLELLPQNENGWLATEQFLRRMVQVLLDYIKTENDRSSKVLDFLHPDELAKVFDFTIKKEPETLNQLIADAEKTLHHSVRTAHPHFFNQISQGLDLVCMAGEWLTATVNTNMFTYEIAPVYVLMEREVSRMMIELIGWNQGDAIWAPGGSISNLYAVNAARHHLSPRVKYLGMGITERLTMFTSQESHYSVRGAAAVCGIGVDNCVAVRTDAAGRMVPEALEKAIIESKRAGNRPFFVCATAGTTVYGAFDPLHQIADICARHDCWFHVDAAWGGGLLVSEKHRHLLSGIERAHSVTWNPHKLMGALLQCSACFIKEEGLLFQCNQMSADYLFQQDKPYDVSYDTGDKAIQCGRHNDIFKLWLMWRSKGTVGMGAQIDMLMDRAAYFTRRIKSTPGYEMVIADPQFLNICFWYVPPSLRQLDKAEKMALLDKIKGRMMERGTTMVGYQPDQFTRRPNFFRLIISNQAVKEKDLDFLIDEIQTLGEDL